MSASSPPGSQEGEGTVLNPNVFQYKVIPFVLSLSFKLVLKLVLLGESAVGKSVLNNSLYSAFLFN